MGLIEECEAHYKEILKFCKAEKDAYNLGLKTGVKSLWLIIKKYKKYGKDTTK